MAEGHGDQPALFFHRADGEPLALAGLWDRQEKVLACTVITTGAGDDLAGIHDRMPVVLDGTPWRPGSIRRT